MVLFFYIVIFLIQITDRYQYILFEFIYFNRSDFINRDSNFPISVRIKTYPSRVRHRQMEFVST
jgi:hypothetical protein